jgi:hypothetical protein
MNSAVLGAIKMRAGDLVVVAPPPTLAVLRRHYDVRLSRA